MFNRQLTVINGGIMTVCGAYMALYGVPHKKGERLKLMDALLNYS